MNTYHILFGIEFESKEHYEQCLNIAIHQADIVNEDYTHCVQRERGLEVQYCREHKLPFVAFDKHQNLLDTNVLIEKLNKQDWRFVLRLNSPLKQTYFGITPLQGANAATRVLFWPSMEVDIHKYTQRMVAFVNAKMFASMIDKFKAAGEPVFIKTLNKGPRSNLTLHRVFTVPEDYEPFNAESEPFTRTWGDVENAPLTYLFKQPDWFCPYRESLERGSQDLVAIDDYIVYSSVMNIIEDSKGRKEEYRCFMVDGKPVSISRYEDYEEFDIPSKVMEFAERFGGDFKGYLPHIYVMDIAATDKGLQLVELNPYEHSGRYFGNKPESFYRALASQDHSPDQWYSWYKEPMSQPAGLSKRELELQEQLKSFIE
ncbi:ATP-grasp domain-containing protein [Vibrio harveyi]|uniref:ATP-grasp domain-containing protein n=1 Tax=Vibrio harveyi TaxID=669 RepID=UPI003CF44614